MDIAFFFQGLQMGTDTVSRADAQRYANLANARWDARGAHFSFDVGVQVFLSFAQGLILSFEAGDH